MISWCNLSHRDQEEESIRAAIALSQAEAEKENAEENEEEKEEDRSDNLLLDLNSSGVCVCVCCVCCVGVWVLCGCVCVVWVCVGTRERGNLALHVFYFQLPCQTTIWLLFRLTSSERHNWLTDGLQCTILWPALCHFLYIWLEWTCNFPHGQPLNFVREVNL